MSTHTNPLALHRVRRLGGRSVALVILGLVLGLLPALASPPALADDLTGVCFLDTDGVLHCPDDDPGSPPPSPRYDPPPLLNPALVAHAVPAQGAALQHFERRAADVVLSRHDLPVSDHDAVLTWARPETEGVLWELVVDAIRTAPSARTADQQAVVDWMAGQANARTVGAAQQAGAEYATWAGLNLRDYRSLAGSGTEAELRDFLSQTPVGDGPIGSAECTKFVCTTQDQQGGYCNYRSPAPYGSEYTGYTVQPCYVPCTGIICLPPAPTFDQLVKWGAAVATKQSRSEGYEVSYGVIATGVVAAAAVAAMATTAVASYIAGSVVTQISIQGLTMFTVFATSVDAAGLTASVVAAAASGAALAVAVVLAGILVSIDFANQSELPGKLAALVVGARAPQLDPAAMLGQDAGRKTLFSLFVSATMPNPRAGSCDNALIPLEDWGSETHDQATVKDPVTGQLTAIRTTPCLNASPVAEPAEDGPHFYVRADGSTYVLARSSLAMAVPNLPGLSNNVRVTGNWFLQNVTDGSSTMRSQSLGLAYQDWDGHVGYVTVARQSDGHYVFTGLTEKGLTQGVDPASCLQADTCFTTDHLRFLGAHGTKYEATLEDTPTTVGGATHSSDPTVFHPVSLDAGGFAMAHPNGTLTYEWDIQTAGCSAPCVVVHGDHTTYTWEKPGTYQVELTATDRAGQRFFDELYVTVASTPPTLTVYPANGGCSGGSVCAGGPFMLWSRVSHDIGSKAETETVRVAWGDGSSDVATNVHGAEGDLTLAVRFGEVSTTDFMVAATHTYPAAGTYQGVVTVHDDAENLDIKQSFTITVAP